jgi:hypothetical protein
MSKKWFIVAILILVAASLSLAACGKGEQKPKDPGEGFNEELAGAPDWVMKGCYAYWGEQQQASGKVCGVGSIGGTRNISLARSGAIARARTDIARTLQVKVQAMLKDYQATVTGGEGFGTQASDEQYVVDVSKQITQMNLSGSEPAEIWISPNGTVFALVILDVEKFKSIVNDANNLPEAIRKAVVERADEAFKELDAATQGAE